VGLPLSLVQRVQAGLQESWRANLWQTAGSLVSLAAVVIAAQNQAGVVWLLLAMSGGPMLVNAINTVIEFWVRKPGLRPSLANYDAAILRSLLRSGAVFVALQVCVLFGSASDSVVIAQLFGAAAVGPYAVLYKLFQTSLIFGLFTYPLWPALGEALARGDYGWAHRALKRALVVVSAAGMILAVLFLFGAREVVHLWVGDRIVPDWLLVSGFAAWILPSAFGGTITSLFNNSQFLRVQLKTYGAASIVALALKVPMAWWLGPAGVVWATVVAYSCVYCLPAGIIARRYFRAKIAP
jgi:O-antigen/teichoic acid export membrane protein